MNAMDPNRGSEAVRAAAQKIDHTLLAPDAGPKEVLKLCEEAIRWRFKAVCIRTQFLEQAAQALLGSGVLLATVVDFPHGNSDTAISVFEMQRAQDLGAVELDAVFPYGLLRAGELDLVRERLHQWVAARRPGRRLKVILESGILSPEERDLAAEIAHTAGVDFLKTSTGFASRGATVEDVRRLSELSGARAEVKASGGIRDLASFLAMIEAGASRIGTSSGVQILQELLS